MKAFIFLPVLVFSSAALFAGEWELAKDKDNIQVYTRKTESSKLKDSRVISTFNATPEQMLQAILDISDYPNWIPTCKQASMLQENGKDEITYYAEYKAPWPVANRDMIVHAVVKRDRATGVIVLDMTGKPEYIPVKDKIVRIPDFKGTWTFTPKGDGKVEAVNEYHTDPGGSIPDWLANMSAVDNPFKMMQNLREKLMGNNQ